LPGDVGDHRPVPGQVPCLLVQSDQGGEIDADVHHRLPTVWRRVPAFEQVEQHVGADLVDAAGFTVGLEAAGDTGEAVHDRRHPIGRQIRGDQGGRPRVVGAGDDHATLDRLFVPPPSVFRIGAQLADPGPQLTRRPAPDPIEHVCGNVPNAGLVEVTGALDDHPRLGKVDDTITQRRQHRGEPFPEIVRQLHLVLGCAAGQTQRRPNLHRRTAQRPLQVVVLDPPVVIEDRHHRLVGAGPGDAPPSAHACATSQRALPLHPDRTQRGSGSTRRSRFGPPGPPRRASR
jgi:hypothetical protein